MKVTKNNNSFLLKTIFVWVVNVLLLGALIFLLFLIQSKSTQIVTLEGDVAEANQQENTSIATQQLVRETAALRAKLDPYFVTDDETTVAFLDAVENIGNEVGVEMTVGVTQVRSDVTNRDALNLRITAEGSLNSVYNALILLENFPAKLTVNDVNLRFLSEDEVTGVRKWSGTITVTLLSYSNE